MRVFRAFASAGAIAMLLVGAIGATAANADSKFVVANGTSPAGCAKNANYASIQAAVNAAPAGATISVCPGTYQEYVTIPASKNNLNIKGMGGDATSDHTNAPVILYPATPNTNPSAFDPNALVEIDGASGVQIESMIVSGPFTTPGCIGPASMIHYGVFIVAGGSAQLQHDYITKIEPSDPALNGCQDGVAVRAGSQGLGQVGNLTLQNSAVDQYEKGGVVVDGTGSTGQIKNSTITGVGPTAQTAQNGIQISRGAVANVENNSVSGNEYAGTAAYSAGILLFSDGNGTSVKNNKLADNDINIDVESDTNASVENNQMTTASSNIYAAGILVEDESGASFKNNKISGGTEGIESFGATSTTYENNDVKGVSDDGVYNDSSSTGNTYKNNKATGSGTFDCQDDSVGTGTSGTANTWMNDKGDTASPPGICK
jgi:hypothetical protein